MHLPRSSIPLAAALQVAMRLGFAKPLIRTLLGRMRSQSAQRSAFGGYQPTRHDVFVATFGKSGTNWMMQIAQQIAHRGEAEFAHIHEVVPWPDAPLRVLTPLQDAFAHERSVSGLRVIKTHLATPYVPYSEQSCYLTIIRDPKEVVVSSYHFLLGIVGATRYVSPDEWFELVVDPEKLVGGWVQHTASFWQWRDRPNALVLTYPEVKENRRGVIQRVAQTMGVELTPSEFEKVVERSSFAWMKRHESQFAPPRLPFVKEPAAMIRRGQSGASDEMLHPTQQARIDEMCRAELKRLGSDFPYDSAFA